MKNYYLSATLFLYHEKERKTLPKLPSLCKIMNLESYHVLFYSSPLEGSNPSLFNLSSYESFPMRLIILLASLWAPGKSVIPYFEMVSPTWWTSIIYIMALLYFPYYSLFSPHVPKPVFWLKLCSEQMFSSNHWYWWLGFFPELIQIFCSTVRQTVKFLGRQVAKFSQLLLLRIHLQWISCIIMH